MPYNLEMAEEGKEPAKKRELSISRKALAARGGLPSVFPSQARKALAGLKEKRASSTATEKWVWADFSNSARADGLQLQHWRKEREVEPDYAFAALKQKVDVIEFTPEEYSKLPADPSWTFEETSHLWSLCRDFDLRFIVIQDRYSPAYPDRTVEDLKERYYSVSRQLLDAREVQEHAIISYPYNAAYERKRKAQLEKYILRTKEQDEEEKMLSEEARKLDARIKKEEKEQKIYEKLMQRDSEIDLPDWPTVKHDIKAPVLRSSFLKQPQLQGRLQKKIDTILADLQVQERPFPTPEIVEAYEKLKKDILVLQYLQKHIVKKEGEKRSLTEKIQDVRRSHERRAQMQATEHTNRVNTALPRTAVSSKMAIGHMNTIQPLVRAKTTSSTPPTPEVKEEPALVKRPRKA